MVKLAELIDLTFKDFSENKEAVLSGVDELCKQFPIY